MFWRSAVWSLRVCPKPAKHSPREQTLTVHDAVANLAPARQGPPGTWLGPLAAHLTRCCSPALLIRSGSCSLHIVPPGPQAAHRLWPLAACWTPLLLLKRSGSCSLRSCANLPSHAVTSLRLLASRASFSWMDASSSVICAARHAPVSD